MRVITAVVADELDLVGDALAKRAGVTNGPVKQTLVANKMHCPGVIGVRGGGRWNF